MNSSINKTVSNGSDKLFSLEEQQEKIKEIRKSLGPLPEKLDIYCSDASITRYLVAQNWNVKKATKMLKDSLKWRHEYKPEEIKWDEVAHEAETGKIYRSNYVDKFGRSVLVMRPGRQNTKSTKGQIRYLVYCMENAILNLTQGEEQMVWLIDFNGFNMGNISVKVTRETANVLQNHYPERLGLAILYNPPKFFESFWTVVKPFLEPKTCRKVKFAYSNDIASKKIIEDLFEMDQLESAFGGNNQKSFNIKEYAEMMREDDKKMPLFWTKQISEISVGRSADPPFLSATNGGGSDLDNLNHHPLGISSPDNDNGAPDSSPDNEIDETNEGSEVTVLHIKVETMNLDSRPKAE